MTDPVQAITRLVFEYADRLDRGDFAGVAELFARSTYRAVVGDRIHVEEGSAAVRSLLERLVITYDGTPSTKHVTTNVVVEVAADGSEATARSYYSVLQAGAGQPLQLVIAGRYHDRFERAGAGWRFADRLIYSDLVGDLTRHLRASPY